MLYWHKHSQMVYLMVWSLTGQIDCHDKNRLKQEAAMVYVCKYSKNNNFMWIKILINSLIFNQSNCAAVALLIYIFHDMILLYLFPKYFCRGH